jgi:hypothetical protein
MRGNANQETGTPVPKLALLFLTRGDLLQSRVWGEFLAGREEEIPLFHHAKHPEAVDSPALRRAVRVPTLPTEWGGISLVRATLRLLEAALAECDATHFALVSESCVPIKPAGEILRRLAMDSRSRIAWEGFGEMSLSHRQRVEKAKGIPLASWRMQHQWMVLEREAVEWVTAEDLTGRFENVFAPDEHYFATALAMMGFPLEERVRKMRTTWVEWLNGGLTTWSGTDGRLALALRESPAFFARKFAVASDIGKWGLHVAQDGEGWRDASFADHAYSRLGPPIRRQAARILVVVVSCRVNGEKRRACRETWASAPPAGIMVRYFTGGGASTDEADTVALPADDSHEALPDKVMASFRHALAEWDFEWIFKCEDDTYVDLERLGDLARDGVDLAGSGRLRECGAPCGGAGYLLSRRMVSMLTSEGKVAKRGAEDLLIGREAMRLGARVVATDRLLSKASPYPRPDNHLITAHHCDPERMRAVHTLRHTVPVIELFVEHASWRDHLLIHQNGVFARKEGYCAGILVEDEHGLIVRWFDWASERLVECEEGEQTDFVVEPIDWFAEDGAEVIDLLADMVESGVETDLIRYGPDVDRGYFVPDGVDYDRIITIGVGNDIGFEAEYARNHPDTHFELFDHTVAGLTEPLTNARFHRMGAGYGADLKPLPDLLDGLLPEGRTTLLKIACEGAEWRCGLDELGFDAVHTLVLELHGLLDPAERTRAAGVLSVIARQFAVVHAHPNNYSASGQIQGHVLANCIDLTLVNKNQTDRLLPRTHAPAVFQNAPHRPAARLEFPCRAERLKRRRPVLRAVFSLSTSPTRIKTLGTTIRSLLGQTRVPDAIHVNCPFVFKRTGGTFAEEDITMLEGLAPGIVRVNRCDDMGPVSKLLPTLAVETDPDTLIVTVDDDIKYPPAMLARMMADCAADHTSVLANRVWRFDGEAPVEIAEGWTGVGIRRGLVEPEDLLTFVRKAITNHDCYRSDDLVLSYYYRLRNIPVSLCAKPVRVLLLAGINDDEHALHKQDGVFHDVRYRRCLPVLEKLSAELRVPVPVEPDADQTTNVRSEHLQTMTFAVPSESRRGQSLRWGIQTTYQPRENLPFLEEWLQWHLGLGAEFFHIYDNTGSTTDRMGNSLAVNGLTRYGHKVDMSLSDREILEIEHEILSKYPVQKVIWQPRENGRIIMNQVAACDHFSGVVKDGWCAFIDMDEFLLPFESMEAMLHGGAIRIRQKKFADRVNYARVLDCESTFTIETRGWATKLIMDMAHYVPGRAPHIHGLCSARPTTDLPLERMRFNHYNHGRVGHEWLLDNWRHIDPEWHPAPYEKSFDERCTFAKDRAREWVRYEDFVPVPMRRPGDNFI